MAYLSLSTANLPDPVIDPAAGKEPADYFVPFIYTGNGADRDIDIGMAPDLVWIKRRNQTGNHMLFDKVRGANKAIYSHLTAAEETLTDRVNSFNSDGWTTGNEDANVSGHTYVAWNWKANGSGVSNTDGSITSTVSANTTSGFSIVKFTQTSPPITAGHGLGQVPDVIIVKALDSTSNWETYHSGLGSNTSKVFLNLTNAANTTSTIWNSTTPTSSVFSWNGDASYNGQDFVAYVFSGVEGFSSFGKYVGNGSTDGPFVYTGFRPAFLLLKNVDSSTRNWNMLDSTINNYNVTDNLFYCDSNLSERTSTHSDFLSNGFKLRNTGVQSNGSGNTIIYMAFAENPFKYSNAR